MKIIELNYEDLNTFDVESSAIIFFGSIAEHKSIQAFGNECILHKDEEGYPFISPWNDDSFSVKESTEESFWNRCCIPEYLEANTEIRRNLIRQVITFWEEWNSTFSVIELEGGLLYGIFWWTTG